MPKRYFNLNLKAWHAIRRRHPLPVSTGTRIQYRLLASALTLAQKAAVRPIAGAVLLKDPIFIIGHWRSGTTLLHELLAASGHFSFPTSHACMRPQAFLAHPSLPPAAAPSKRPMDDMMVSPASAMEGEFALLGLGARSAYEAFLIPDAITDIVLNSDPAGWPEHEAEEWTQYLLAFLAACQMAGGDRRLILKSPTHAFRLSFLDRLFPRAAYLHIDRNPEDILASTLAMWRTMWDLYAITPIPDAEIVERAVLDSMLAARQQASAFASRHPDRFHSLRFEELVADPMAVLGKAGAALALADLCNDGVAAHAAAIRNFTRKPHLLSGAQKTRLRERLYSG